MKQSKGWPQIRARITADRGASKKNEAILEP